MEASAAVRCSLVTSPGAGWGRPSWRSRADTGTARGRGRGRGGRRGSAAAAAAAPRRTTAAPPASQTGTTPPPGTWRTPSGSPGLGTARSREVRGGQCPPMKACAAGVTLQAHTPACLASTRWMRRPHWPGLAATSPSPGSAHSRPPEVQLHAPTGVSQPQSVRQSPPGSHWRIDR